MPDTDPLTIEQVMAIKRRHEAALMRRPNVVGVGVGLVETAAGFQPAIPGIVITVRQAPAASAFPAELEGAPVQVLEIGTPRGQNA